MARKRRERTIGRVAARPSSSKRMKEATGGSVAAAKKGAAKVSSSKRLRPQKWKRKRRKR